MKRALFAIACSIAASGALAQSAKTEAYRNAAVPAPASWQGPTFKLSHDYPQTKPQACSVTECPWLGIPLPTKTNFTDAGIPVWKDGGVYDNYINAILDYVKKGQTTDLNNQEGLKVQVNGKTEWFHIPWMAFDKHTGREFVHGLTNELDFRKPTTPPTIS